MTSKTLLRRALATLKEVGWAKGAWATDSGREIAPEHDGEGRRLVMLCDGKEIPVTRADVTGVCELGALMLAGDEKGVDDDLFDEAARILAAATVLESETYGSYEEYVLWERGRGEEPVSRDEWALDVVRDEGFLTIIPDFNDASGTEEGDVIRAFQRAIRMAT